MNVFPGFGKGQEKSELEQALADCRRTAREGYRVASENVKGIEADIDAVSADLKRNLSKLDNRQVNTNDLSAQLRRQLQEAVSQFGLLPKRLRASLAEKYARLNKFSIALFGRTMAGKSTLMEILTNGDGSSIGKGSQRTTRDVRSYEWKGLTVTDVPGIAAFEGREDEEVAFEAAEQADLVLFLITDDAPQDEEAKCLARVRALGKPILGLLNVKAALHNADELPLLRRKFEPERLGAIVEQFHEFADRYGPGARIPFFSTHLRAKFLSQQPDYELQKKDLESASRFHRVEEEITSEMIGRGAFLRWKSFIDDVVCPTMEVSEKFLKFSYENSSSGRVFLNKKRQVETWSHQFRKDGEERIATFIEKEMNALRAEIPAFAENNYDRRDAGERWDALVERQKLSQKARKLVEQIQEECRDELSDSTRQLKAELDFVSRFAGDKRISMDAIFDAKRAWDWFTNSLTGGLVIASLILGGVPLVWAAAAVAVGFAGWLVSQLLESRREKAQKQRVELKDKLEADVERIENKLKEELHKCFFDEILEGQVHAHLGELSTIVSDVSALADVQGRLAWRLNRQQKNLHRALLDEALRHPGREDCGSLVRDVARVPGQAMLLLMELGAKMPEDVHRGLEKMLGEQVLYAVNTPNKVSILVQVIGHGCKRSQIRIEPDIQGAHVPVDDLNAATVSRIRLAQQLTELYVMK